MGARKSCKFVLRTASWNFEVWISRQKVTIEIFSKFMKFRCLRKRCKMDGVKTICHLRINCRMINSCTNQMKNDVTWVDGQRAWHDNRFINSRPPLPSEVAVFLGRHTFPFAPWTRSNHHYKRPNQHTSFQTSKWPQTKMYATSDTIFWHCFPCPFTLHDPFCLEC